MANVDGRKADAGNQISYIREHNDSVTNTLNCENTMGVRSENKMEPLARVSENFRKSIVRKLLH